MDTPGSDIPPGSTGISTTDTSTAASPKHNIPSVSPNEQSSNNHTVSIIENDSASDVSMSADSDDEDDDTLDIQATQLTPNIQVSEPVNGTMLQSSQPETSRKRKHSESREDDPHGQINNTEFLEEMRKRLKPYETQDHWRSQGYLHLNRSVLPAELWHHIFTFTPPKTLGNLLQVNKSFNKYLDPSSDSSIVPLSKSSAQVLKPDAIWRASRRHFQPSMPAPLVGQTELDMWRMACSASCQFCNKKTPSIVSLQSDQWHLGPGENGVIPIWSFAVRSCGHCLLQHAVKEVDLLLSSSVPTLVMPALPFIFLTNELHVIPATALQHGQPPSTIQITKYYFKNHIEAIKGEFESVKAMGSATIEEWLKGLEDRGKARRTDAARWERWEASGGVSRMKNLVQREHSKEVSAAAASDINSAPAQAQPMLTNGFSQLPNHTSVTHPPPQVPKSLPTIHTSFPSNPPPRYDSPSQSMYSAYTPRSNQQPKHERTKEEVADLKAARRAEIERRCLSLNPPLTANVLAHMSSFQAAIQIIQPLNDGAWEVLKPRLLSQREEAEQRENDRIAQSRVVEERSEERRFQDIQVKPEYKDAIDREWDDIQAPLRARIGGYADETIRDGWNGGDKATKETSPRFAADVLIYVRKRFYAEIAKEDAALRATGQEPPSDPPMGPYTRKLTLENMKWVFDTKIKPHTEQYSKELFLCNSCENNFKYYGFEGVIQHFAAKHTSSLSVGSVVVHWKSEWPEYPPFCPDPNAAIKNAYYSATPSASTPYPNSSIPPNYGYGGYQQPVSAAPNSHVYQDPYHAHSQYGNQYSAPQPGPYAPQQIYQDPNQGHSHSQYSAAPASAIIPGYSDSHQNYAQSGYEGSYPTPIQPVYTSLPPNQIYPTSIPDSNVQPSSYVPQSAQYPTSYNQPPVYSNGNYLQMSASASQQAQAPTSPPPQKTEEYKAQLRELGRDARAIWNSMNGVKEVPGSVKVYTIIYHILKRFRSKFQQDPPLSMIVDGLSNNKDMRPVRNINGLLCRACVLGMAGSVTPSKPEKKHYSFPQLAIHFRTIHEEGVPSNLIGHFPDWSKDMVELPDQAKISSVSSAPGMDDQKLAIFSEALQEIVAIPPPKKDATTQRTLKVEALDQGAMPWQQIPYANQDMTENLAPSQDNHGKYYGTVADTCTPDTEPVSAIYNSNPYDPHHHRDTRERQSSRNPTSLGSSSRHNQGNQVSHHKNIDRHRPIKSSAPSVSYARPEKDYGFHTVRGDVPVYSDRDVQYRESKNAEQRPRYERTIKTYDDLTTPMREYAAVNSQSHKSNRQDEPLSAIPATSKDPLETQCRPLEDAKSQQNRIFEVVAQISHQAQQARGRQTVVREGAARIGSEDAELQREIIGQTNRKRPSDEATNDAERFLTNFQPERRTEVVSQRVEQPARRREDVIEPTWEAEHAEIMRQRRPLSPESQYRLREAYNDDSVASGRPNYVAEEQGTYNGYYVQERPSQSRQIRPYATEDHYVDPIHGQSFTRERSLEIIDRRHTSNVFYRDERQGSHGAHRTPSRYARYESVRLENDRARSRSPVYVKVGAQPGQYTERSPGTHLSHQEPIYRTRTPKEEILYERAPRQEYYRVYADEPRPRQAYEYVQYDAQGPYVIHRPVRREPETVYAAYEDNSYSRQPLYEARAAVSRADPAYYEEYDPRHPEPPPATAASEVRYQ
ncbi:hypothetical protein DSL72_002331 [Monilinia vaccinii-corymbosi]|uniref:DUF7892 domain-containing protein n=1 Tax=Monilinia vaccinii-corymbosi TaxID=61207 RepID=A0A8A3PC94_9HELO|nr:hypothetical protein DSL72_002331 [Monilinia vaccinii-corymbosi]